MSDFDRIRPLEFIKVWKNFDRVDPLVWLFLAMNAFVVVGLFFESVRFIVLIGGFVLVIFLAVIGVNVWRGILRR